MANINIYGVLYNNTPDGIIVRTEQIADNNGKKLTDVLSPVDSISDLKNSVDTLTKSLSADNFKTINGESVYGPGEITITSEGKFTIDGELNSTSINPVQNKVITNAISNMPNESISTDDIDTMMVDTSVIYLNTYFEDDSPQEINVETPVTLYFSVTLDTVKIIPDSMSILNQELTTEEISSGKKTFNISQDTSFNIVVNYLSISKSFVVDSPKFIWSIYIGTSSTDTISSFNDLSNKQKLIKSIPIDDINISVNDEYVWICSTEEIGNVYSSEGFIIPVEQVSNVDNYKYYRTVDKPQSDIIIKITKK